jgi:hypothetical protein
MSRVRSPFPAPHRRSALARDLRLAAHRRAARPGAASTARLTPRKRSAPAAGGSSLLRRETPPAASAVTMEFENTTTAKGREETFLPLPPGEGRREAAMGHGTSSHRSGARSAPSAHRRAVRLKLDCPPHPDQVRRTAGWRLLPRWPGALKYHLERLTPAPVQPGEGRREAAMGRRTPSHRGGARRAVRLKLDCPPHPDQVRRTPGWRFLPRWPGAPKYHFERLTPDPVHRTPRKV